MLTARKEKAPMKCNALFKHSNDYLDLTVMKSADSGKKDTALNLRPAMDKQLHSEYLDDLNFHRDT